MTINIHVHNHNDDKVTELLTQIIELLKQIQMTQTEGIVILNTTNAQLQEVKEAVQILVSGGTELLPDLAAAITTNAAKSQEIKDLLP
jgi:hypothetical protein